MKRFKQSTTNSILRFGTLRRCGLCLLPALFVIIFTFVGIPLLRKQLESKSTLKDACLRSYKGWSLLLPWANQIDLLHHDRACLQAHLKAHGAPIIGKGKPTRGIVYSGGGRDQISNIIVNAHYIRHTLRSQMPIEVFYYGDQEMPHALASMLMDASLQPLHLADTSYKDYPTWQRPTHMIRWMPKIWALYRGTSFDEVLLLDADSVPLVQPEELFNTPAYLATGSLFTPDYWTNWEMKDELYTTFGLQPPYQGNPNFKSMESGQLVFNRRKLSAVLEWIWFINAHHDATYSWMYGDKDSFRLGFALAGAMDQFSQSPTWPSLAVTQASEGGGTEFRGAPIDYHHSVVVQYGWNGEPLFAHQLKFWPKVVSGPGAQEGIDVTRPQWVTVPSSHDRLFMLLEMGCLGISKAHADDTSYLGCMGRHAWPTASVNTVVDVCGWRDSLNSSTPIPLFPTKWLGGLEGGLKALSDTFKRLRPEIDSARSEPLLVKSVGRR